MMQTMGFSDSYVELMNLLEVDNRRIIVSGLLPRQSVDLKPYNERLKKLYEVCEEMTFSILTIITVSSWPLGK